jgi:serine/threonine protein kinase
VVRWGRTGGAGLGGLGVGFVAVDDSTGRQAFVKRLHRPRDTEARKRFYREVAAYETLSHRGLPKLFEANREQWREPDVELYLVLEYIRGDTLGQWVGTHGPMSIEVAVAFADAVGDALEHCHAEDVLHRDLKPANVVLRDDDPADPVVVDFGLSFNTAADVEDITWTGQEIGNRFLRLSEAWQNRTAISDVPQLAGLFFFALTGVEPRMLLDDDGQCAPPLR